MATRRSNAPVLRSHSPAAGGRFYGGCSKPSSSSSAFASSSSSSFSARTFLHHHRAASPTRVNLYSSPSSSPSVRFNSGSVSPNRSISTQSVPRRPATTGQKKTCMCSPTNHPGSFRCSLHKNVSNRTSAVSVLPYQSNRLYARRSAMTNSLVRIGTVEGDLVKRALASLIRPSSHQQKRRGDFLPKKSRLSLMSTA